MRKIILALAAALSLAPGLAFAEDAAGDWVGVLKAGGAELHVGLRLQKAADGSVSGVFDSFDQGVRNLPVSDVAAAPDSLSFAIKPASARFEGKWDPARKAWVGTWSQGPNTLPLELTRGTIAAAPTVAGLDGDWDGALEGPGGVKLRLAFHIRTTPADGTVVTLDSIDQGANGIPVTAISRDGAKVHMDLKIVAGTFDGTLDSAGQSIAGQWTQPTLSAPLTLTRRAAGAKQVGLNRPQTPKPPFPYRSEDVVFEDAAAHVKLAGTLTLPQGPGPFPAVVLIAGSGPNTRDEPLLGHQHFLVLADHLTRNGVAVLRFDKRGTGASSGDYDKATSLDFADDVDAGVGFLKGRKEIDARHIGLIGHSEGGLIGPIVAVHDPDVRFLVMMAGPGVNGLDIMMEQGRLIAKANGMDDAKLQKASTMRRELFDIARDEKDPAVAVTRARQVMAASAKEMGLPDALVDAQVKQITTDWFRFFLTYDPATNLRKLRIPVLVLNGSNDLQVPPAQNLPPIRAALAGDPDAEIYELPGLNHLFQTSKTGSPSEYAQIEETIAPPVLDLMTRWILRQSKR
jgi:pimeloyl-ACP methyl ester carboxylesterase